MNHLMIDGYVFEFEGVFSWQTAPSVWSDQLQNCLCCRDGVGLGGHRVLRDRSHLVPDTGRHLTCANVSTPGDIHTPISQVSNYISPSIPSHVFFFFIFLPLSILSLTSFHLSCIFFFFLCFSRLFLIPTCNSPSVFSLIVSLLLPPALCVCLVIRQMSWIRQKSTFPSMFLCFFCIVMYFWNCAVGFDWVQA